MYDEAKADRVVQFIKLLRHTKGRWAGVPFNLTPWQEGQIIRPLFGTVNEDGTRQYRTGYLSFPRKNGKSEIGSAIGLDLLVADGEMGAEIYSAAADREQAAIVFNTAVSMIKQSPTLLKRVRLLESQRKVIVPKTDSFWRVLSADAFTKHGLNPHGVIFDELHAQPNRELWDVMTTGFGARSQPLLIAITTAGYDKHSICYEQYDYAKRVLSGDIDDPTYFACIYEADQEDDWQSPDVWRKANPALGDYRSFDELRDMARRAAQVPALQNTFRRLYLNQWTEQAERWLDMSAWDDSAGEVNPDELKGQECYGGLDLASTRDLTAFVLVFPREKEPLTIELPDGRTTPLPAHVQEMEGDHGVAKVLAWFWIPSDQMHERVNRDRVPYDVWVREGLIKATPGNVVDYATIEADIKDICSRYVAREIAFDRWNALQIVQNLEEEGLTMVPLGQGFASMAGPTKEFETRVLQKQLHHGGNPVLRWMASNVAVKQDEAGNLKPDKSKSTEKIDGIVAAIMALDRVVRHENEGPSVYEDRGMIVL